MTKKNKLFQSRFLRTEIRQGKKVIAAKRQVSSFLPQDFNEQFGNKKKEYTSDFYIILF